MTRSDRWTDHVLAFLAGVLLTTVIGGWAVPKVHAALEDDVRFGPLMRPPPAPETTISREASVREYRQRAYVALDSARKARARFAACRDSLYAVGVLRVPGLGP